MRINKLSASFGELQNQSLKFHEGLNVISSPSEDINSSWCAFIKAMLYGIAPGRIGAAGSCLPGSGAPAEGSMELTANHCDITLNRSTIAKNAPMGEFSAVYTGTDNNVEELNRENAGVQLTGVSESAFARSAFIHGSGRGENKLCTLISSGAEDSSYPGALRQLSARQAQLKNGENGILDRLEEEISQREDRLRDMEQSAAEAEALTLQLRQTRQDCLNLELAVTESRKKQRKDSLSSLNSGRAELTMRSDRHDEAMESLSQRREELRAHRFGDRTRQELEQEVSHDVGLLKQLSSVGSGFFIMLPALLCFVLAIVFTALYNSRGTLFFIIAAGIFCVGAVVLLLRYAKLRQNALKAREKTKKIMKKYKASEIEDIYSLLQEHSALWDRVDEAKQAELESRVLYESARGKQAELENEALQELDFASGSSQAAKFGRELSAAREKAQTISTDIAQLKGRLSALGDPAVLSGELKGLRDEYARFSDEYSSLSIASAALKEAAEEMERKLSPELWDSAVKYLSSVTGEKYEPMADNPFLVSALKAGDRALLEAAGLSDRNTEELMYLAARLAVSSSAVPKGEAYPLIIDDALSAMDPERREQAMQLLTGIARKRQVIVFTSR